MEKKDAFTWLDDSTRCSCNLSSRARESKRTAVHRKLDDGAVQIDKWPVRHCPVNGWVRGAQLTQQMGGSGCAQGRSWGYDDNEVWVDRGCQGEFRVYIGGRPSGRSTVVRCSSQNGTRKTCPVNGYVSGATVEQQFSGSPCIQGSTWGFDRSNLWVNSGCRADFRVWLR